eukprot:1682747-Heterocapsa_arctica.AAC.1
MSTGSSAALPLNQREGLGKARRIDVQELWVQAAVRQKRLAMDGVPSEHKPADPFAKGLSADRMMYLMSVMGYSHL